MAESDLEKNAEFTQIFNKHGGEEDPVIAAQRFLNIFRQLHIFTPAKRKEFDELLLNQSSAVKGTFASLPGGSVLQEYVNNLEQNAGMKKTQAKIIATSPEINDEISKAKILASALAEAQAQIQQSSSISDVNSQEFDAITTQLRKEMNRLKKDFQEIKENQTTIDISQLPTETLNEIQKSIERKISNNTFSGTDTLKIVADESLKDDLVQIITKAIKENADARYLENREFAETLSESHLKMAELFADANIRTAELISHASIRPYEGNENPSYEGNSDTFNESVAHYAPSMTADNLGNILATVLKESNINSTQMLVDTLKSFQQENLKILEMQTELQKAMLDVSRSIQISRTDVVNDELNLESLDSDLENGVPAPVYLPEDKPTSSEQEAVVNSVKQSATQPQQTATSVSSSQKQTNNLVQEKVVDETPDEEDDGILTADDLFADIDGEQKAETDSTSSNKKKKKKKKKNKNKTEQEVSATTQPQNKPQVSSISRQNPFYQQNPLLNNSPANPLFVNHFMNIPSEAVQDKEEDSSWGFTPTESSLKSPQVDTFHDVSHGADSNTFLSGSPSSVADTDNQVFDNSSEWEYVEEPNNVSASQETEQDWEYVEQEVPENSFHEENPVQVDSSLNTADEGEWEWEYVEETDDNSSHEAEQEWEYVDENAPNDNSQEWTYAQDDVSNNSEENEGEWEWEYVEESDDTSSHETEQEWEYVDENSEGNEETLSETYDDSPVISSEGETATKDDNRTQDSTSFDSESLSNTKSSPSELEDENIQNESDADSLYQNNESVETNNSDEVDANLSSHIDEKTFVSDAKPSSGQTASSEILTKDEIPEFQISGISTSDDTDPFAQ